MIQIKLFRSLIDEYEFTDSPAPSNRLASVLHRVTNESVARLVLVNQVGVHGARLLKPALFSRLTHRSTSLVSAESGLTWNQSASRRKHLLLDCRGVLK